MSFKVGEDVHYVGHNKTENGRVKEIDYGQQTAFVVYHCNNDWNNYRNYTATLTNLSDLKIGWNYEE